MNSADALDGLGDIVDLPGASSVWGSEPVPAWKGHIANLVTRAPK